MPQKSRSVGLDFYGIKAEVRSDDAAIVEGIRRDFEYFVSEAAPRIRIRCEVRDVDYAGLSGYKATGYGRGCIIFGEGAKKAVDYRGQALSVYDYQNESGVIISPDPSLLYELCYLLLLSRVGEHLDHSGMHRVHGFAVKAGSDGILCLLPEGGGKTTTLLSLLKEEYVELISDDTPIVQGGRLLPFPIRISLCEKDAEHIPARFKRAFHRRMRDSKVLVDLEYFKPRISSPVKASKILIGSRNLTRKSSIRRVGRIRAVWPLMRDMTFGLGVPQLVEHFLRNTPSDHVSKALIFGRRLISAATLISQSEVYEYDMGLDRTANITALTDFLRPKG